MAKIANDHNNGKNYHMNPKKRVAIFTTSDLSTVQGSTEAHYVASEFAEEYDLDVVSRFDPEMLSVEYYPIPNPTLIPAFVLYNFLLLPYFLYLSMKNQYDVIYTYKGFNIAPFLVTLLTGAKWIADFRTKPTGQTKEWSNLSGEMSVLEWAYISVIELGYRLTLPRTHAVIGLSEPVCDHLHREFGVPREKIYLVPLGVDTERFRPGDWIDPRNKPINIVYLGSITPRRGLETVLSAISSSKLKARIQLHIIGSGPEEYERQLREQIKSAGIESEVTWHGYVDHDDLPDRLSGMDAAVSPLPDHDSYEVSSPAKIYEYLAVGLPIVCTDIRAHRTILTENCTGFFYKPGCRESLVDSLNTLSKLNEDQWLNRRKSARETALKNDWSLRIKIIKTAIRINRK